jgi:preprotein translocase subunit SecD
MDHKSLHVRLRSGVLQVITSIVAFSVVVEYTGSSEYNYIVFTGVSGFVVALAFMACYAARVQAVRFHHYLVLFAAVQHSLGQWHEA